MLTYILFALGFVFLVKGADFLVEGSSSIAKKLGISDLVIGLTIVSFGTSAPELVVNIMASVKGASDIGIGNIIGSNIANIFLILGVSGLIYPLAIKKTTTWKAVPLNLLAVIVLFFMANDVFFDGAAFSSLGRIDGLLLMAFFLIFMSYTISLAKTEKQEKEDYNGRPIYLALLMTIGGIIGLAYGGQWVVDGAVAIAESFGLSQALIGLTIVAIGTSAPELATSAVAAYKHKNDIAIGNVVGSNLFNIFWVLGLSAIIRPLPIASAVNVDFGVLLLATIMLFAFAFTGRKNHIDRAEGAIFITCYVAYIIFLVIRG